MSSKHNTKHPDRGRSHYGQRLEARGLSQHPVMADVFNLRRKQATEAWLLAHPEIVANLEDLHKRGIDN